MLYCHFICTACWCQTHFNDKLLEETSAIALYNMENNTQSYVSFHRDRLIDIDRLSEMEQGLLQLMES